MGGGVEHGPVVGDRRTQTLRSTDGLLHPGQVPRGVVTRRPVGPEPRDEVAVVRADQRLCERGLEQKDVEAALDLVVGEERRGERRHRRCGHRHHLGEAVGVRASRPVGRERAPVVTDEHRRDARTEELVERGMRRPRAPQSGTTRQVRARSARTRAGTGRWRGNRTRRAPEGGVARSMRNPGIRAGR